MRLTDLLGSQKVITKERYERLRPYGFKPVTCDCNGWEFSSVENMSENEARKWIRELRLKQRFEKANNVEPSITGFVIFVEDNKDEPLPEWPVELQPYRDKTNNILEAYLCNKFNLPCE